MLFRKMLRDIKNNLSQFITIFLMVAIGVMAYSGIEAYMDGMVKSRDTFNTNNNIQDVNLIGKFDRIDLENIKKIENIKDAEFKLSVTGTTDNDKTLLINFIESNNISKFYVFEGEEFSNKSGVWIDSFYAKENNIKVGDIIRVKYENLDLKEKVLGIINIPDHLYDVRDESELYPDRKEFGIAYLSTNEITRDYIVDKYIEYMNTQGIFDLMIPEDFDYKNYIPFNSVMVDIDNLELRDKTKEDIEDNIKNALAIINIEDTSSYVAYQGEIDEGKTYVGVFSGLFLFIAMLSVITTMTRVVKKQRIQIGTLKALGFKDIKILFHYISYGLFISLIGSIVGLLLGYYGIGTIFMNLQMAFFEMPNGKPSMATSSYIVAIGVVLGVSFISYLACKSVLKEKPAEALRNKIPNVKKNSLNITTKKIFKKLSFSSIWNIRDIIRNKARTLMGVAGVVGCSMLIVCSFGMLDSMNYFIKLQFEDLYNFDYKLTLKEDITKEDIKELESVYGKNTSKTLQIEIKNNGKREANNIFVDDSNNLVRFVDNKGKLIKLDRNDGVYVTYKLAKINNYKIGDKITWHIYGDSNYYESEIVGFNKDPQNQNITMTRSYYESLGFTYLEDVIYSNKDLSNTKEIKNVEVIQDKTALKDGMRDMLSMMRTMLVLIITVAIILGSIIIYNLGILSYTEKQYQFATLKVLGFKDKQIKKIFIKQNNWIAIISSIIGLPLGYYLTDWLFKTAIEEHYDFGASIRPITYVIAGIGTFIVSYVVSKLLSRKVKDIDMVTSLKGNE